MSSADYGPVPVSRVGVESPEIAAALNVGRRVLISQHGRVVAAIDPVGGDGALGSTPIGQLDHESLARAIEQNSGFTIVANGRPMGVFRLMTEAELAQSVPTPEQVAERERSINVYFRNHPGADAGELARYADLLDSLSL